MHQWYLNMCKRLQYLPRKVTHVKSFQSLVFFQASCNVQSSFHRNTVVAKNK